MKNIPWQNRLIIAFVLIATVLRFYGIASSPPGFYVDEAVGAANVLCIHQTGSDLSSHSLPLFSQGLGKGYYTAPYLYGELFWTSIFGTSVTAFRTFLAFITTLTLGFLFLWLRKRVSEKAAYIGILLASISPWAFQFARIAWDPPLAPFFLMLALWFFDLEKKWNWIAGTLALALASYSYPAARLQAAVLLVLIPGFAFRSKIKSLVLFGLSMIPMVWYTIKDPNFTVRTKMLILWSGHPMNPYRNDSFFELIGDFLKQVSEHLTPTFLFVSGDQNLRHSSQSVGMMSWPEGLLLTLGIFFCIGWFFRTKKKKEPSAKPTVYLALFLLTGAFLGLASASLTWEGAPHALRAIGAWPFFILLAALVYDRIEAKFPKKLFFPQVFTGLCILFAGYFYYHYFNTYPTIAQGWFQTEQNDPGLAYERMTRQGVSCETLQAGVKNGSF